MQQRSRLSRHSVQCTYVYDLFYRRTRSFSIGKGGMLTVCIPNAAIWQKKEHIYKIIDSDGHATAADDDRRMPSAK